MSDKPDVPIKSFIEEGSVFISIARYDKETLELRIFMKKDVEDELKDAGVFCYQICKKALQGITIENMGEIVEKDLLN